MSEYNRSFRSRSKWSGQSSVIFALIFILSACTSNQAPATATGQVTPRQMLSLLTPVSTMVNFTSTPTSSEVSSWTPTHVYQQTSEPAPTGIPWYAHFSNLPPGQYLLYEDRYPETFVIGVNGQENRKLVDGAQIPFRSQGRQMWRLGPDLLDWEQNTLIKLDRRIYACGADGISPNLDMAVSICDIGQEDSKHPGKVILYDFVNGTQRVLFEKEDINYNLFLSPWSPDGKWLPMYLAYPNHEEPWKSLGKPDAGLYLWDVSCLKDTNECAGNPRGPFKVPAWVFYADSWSPDSRSIAFSSTRVGGGFEIFDVESGEYRSLLATAGYGPISTLSWSPDGKWLAYARRASESDDSVNIYLMPVTGGPSRLLDNSHGDAVILGWITVPLPLKIGEEYIISQEGANLPLQSDPSLSGRSIALLQADERVKIIDGPVSNDGYRWWKMQVITENVEGWVTEHPDWFIPVTGP